MTFWMAGPATTRWWAAKAMTPMWWAARSDIVDETSAGADGLDTVRSTVTFSLVASSRVKGEIEDLTLEGSGNINGTGNALNNVITGNGGNNVLAGLGGADRSGWRRGYRIRRAMRLRLPASRSASSQERARAETPRAIS